MPFVSSIPHYLVPLHAPAITVSSVSSTNSSLFLPWLCFPLPPSRSDRVPRDDGRGLRVGRPGWSDWPTADPPHLPLHQQRVCLLLILRPGLRLLPLLPPGLWCGVRRQMSHTGTAARAGNEIVTTTVAHRFTWQTEQCHMSEDR